MFEIRARNECPWDKRTCSWASKNGHLSVYTHESRCPWSAWTCYNAAKGHLECLKYAHEKGCPWDEGLVLKLLIMVSSSV